MVGKSLAFVLSVVDLLSVVSGVVVSAAVVLRLLAGGEAPLFYVVAA